jgi:hypothetical protein
MPVTTLGKTNELSPFDSAMCSTKIQPQQSIKEFWMNHDLSEE